MALRLVTDVATHGTRKHGNGGRKITQVIGVYCLPCSSHDPEHSVSYVPAGLFADEVKDFRAENPSVQIRCKACAKKYGGQPESYLLRQQQVKDAKEKEEATRIKALKNCNRAQKKKP